MKRSRSIAVAVVSLAAFSLTGCESARNDFATGVREKFSGPTYQTRTFTGERLAIFEAARKSAEELGFRITKAGAAQGVIEGLSGLASDDRLSGSRQRSIKIRLTSAIDQSTEVGVLLTEVVEDDFAKGPGQGTETTLRESPLYSVFFTNLTRLLVR